VGTALSGRVSCCALLPAERRDSIAQATMDDLAHDTLARATNQIVKNAEFVTAVNEAMQQFAVDRNVEAVINVLKNRYDQL
jgi:hypothetical protein